MKKRLSRIMAFLLTAIMVIGSMSLTVFADEPEEYTAFLMFTDRNWGFGNWDETLASATTKVTGPGTYSVVLNADEVRGEAEGAASGAMVFCVDILGLGASKYMATDVKVLCDGVELEMDSSKLAYGDIEEKGNYRIELYNEYGSTVNDPAFDPEALTFNETLEVQFTLEEVGATAFLMFTDRNWGFGNWDATLESATARITGDGTYSVVLNAEEVGGDGATPASGAMVFCVDILNLAKICNINDVTVSDVKILCDGENFKISDDDEIIVGDIEENGNLRIELYNEYGDTINTQPIDPEALSFAKTLEVQFTISGIVFGTTTPAPEAEEETTAEPAAAEPAAFDANGTYNVYIGIQSAAYSFRNAWDEESYGKATEYFSQITGWDGTTPVVREGEINDAVITGNGTYTVSIKGLNLNDGAETLNLLFLSTDIPVDSGVEFSDITIRMGGKKVYEFETAFLDPDSTDYLKPLIINTYNNELTASDEFAYTLSEGMDIEITFTVSGFAYDNANQAEPETTAKAPEATEAPTMAASSNTEADSSVSVGLIVGIVAAVVVVAAIVVVVLKKKKN